MRISLNWLGELVDITLSPEDLARTLTVAGFEVEEIEDLRTLAEGVVVGKVLDCQPHPNANKLKVCQVDIGKAEPANIVCGASNVRAGIFVPVALPKTYLPAIDLKLKISKLRGVRSEGMICSLTELGLEKDSDGIYIFPEENLQPGEDVRPLLGLDDIILDLVSTANRADGLSMVGVAREVVALTDGEIHLPPLPQVSIPQDSPNLTVNITNTEACPAYIGTVIEGVTIAPSPHWLQWRLQAAGVRPINNVVDVTNWILLEWGQPLHAFDGDRLQEVTGSDSLTLGVRFAKSDESLKTLDGQTRKLESETLLITANDHPIALGGVMGGEETEVHEGTVNIVLEAALFNPVTIRRSARTQGLRTEASARYERGVNQAELEIACQRAISLLQDLAGGTPVTQKVSDTRPHKDQLSRSIELRLPRLNQILGPTHQGSITTEDVEKILTALGCQLTPQDESCWIVKVPPYRYRDLEREIDLIEEVARLYGYDNFCDTLPSKTQPGVIPPQQSLKMRLRESLRAVGLTELMHYSLGKPEPDKVSLKNPLLREYSSLRLDLVTGLIEAFEYNYAQGNGALNGFEIGRVFWKEEDVCKETDSLAGIVGGDRNALGRWVKAGKAKPMTWFDAKGILESVFSRLNLAVTYQPDSEDERFHPGRTASLWLGKQRLGRFGQLHPQLCRQVDIPDAVYVFELSVSLLLEVMNQDQQLTPHFHPYSSYPATERDLALFAPITIPVTQLEALMTKAGKKLLEKVELFDEYRGDNVPEGQRSLAFSLAYRASDRTLTDEEVEPVHEKIRQALVKEFEITLRS